MSLRMRKVSETMREVLGELIEFKLKDPRVDLTTVSAVDVTSDLRNATVYLSMFGGEAEKEGIVDALNGAAGFLRTELGKRMRTKHTPKLLFKEDLSIERGVRIERLLKEMEHDRGPETEDE